MSVRKKRRGSRTRRLAYSFLKRFALARWLIKDLRECLAEDVPDEVKIPDTVQHDIESSVGRP